MSTLPPNTRPCPGCGEPLPVSRGVCPECGHVTPWFRIRFFVGCGALSVGFIALMFMIYMMLQAPPPGP